MSDLLECDYRHSRYEEHLISSDLSLKAIDVTNRYYTVCVRAGQDVDAVIDEILNYESGNGIKLALSFD